MKEEGKSTGGGREDGRGCRVSGRGFGRFAGETGRWPECGGECWGKVEREEELEERMVGGLPEMEGMAVWRSGGGGGLRRRRRRLEDGGLRTAASR